MLPKVGLNVVPLAYGRLAEAARLAESLGYESIWMGEHVLTPVGYRSAYPGATPPFAPDSPFLEPLVALAHIAAHTTTVRIGTGVLMLPVRDPFLTARALATLDVLSGGRLEIGVGLGWMKEEYDAMGRDWSTRASRMEEFVHVLTALFADGEAEFDGEHFRAPRMGFGPRPIQRPRPPLLLGGHTPRALRRAARLGDGWYGGSAAVADAATHIATLRREREAAGLDPDDFTLSAVILHEPTAGELRELAEAGLHRVVVTPWRRPRGPAHPGDVTGLSAIPALAEKLGLSPAA